MAKRKRQKKNKKRNKQGKQTNPVAKYARQVNKHDVHQDKTKYNRNEKHKTKNGNLDNET